jgi:hypothetical protein
LNPLNLTFVFRRKIIFCPAVEMVTTFDWPWTMGDVEMSVHESAAPSRDEPCRKKFV